MSHAILSGNTHKWFEQFQFAQNLDMWKNHPITEDTTEDTTEDMTDNSYEEDENQEGSWWEDGPSSGWDDWEGEVRVKNATVARPKKNSRVTKRKARNAST